MKISQILGKISVAGITPNVERSRPQIIESYRDYAPPAWVRKLVEDALDSVPDQYLGGLKTIVLTNRSALTRDQRRQKIWQRGKTHRLAEARGAYYRATRSRPASVWLYVDNILKPIPSWCLGLPIVSTVEITEVLFHEIGHHIHAVHKPVYDGKENVAEAWSRRLIRRFTLRRYWYAMPLAYPLAKAFNLAERIKKRISRGGKQQR